jgi:signal peptidase II
MDRLPLNRYALFLLPAFLGCAADLATKSWIFSWPELRAGNVHWFWTGHVGLELSRNWGALFGIGQGHVWLFATLSIAAAIAIPVWLFWFRAAHDGWFTFALGCVMAGVLGNLYDRLGLSGEDWAGPALRSADAVYAVRDWILWQISDRWRWPNFNLADSFLVCGAALLFFHALRQPAAPGNRHANGKSAPRVRSDASSQ